MTVGVVGYGSIGRTVARLAAAFGARVVATRRHHEARRRGTAAGDGARRRRSRRTIRAPGRCSRESDFVVLAAPLTPETEGLIDAAALASMRRTRG